ILDSKALPNRGWFVAGAIIWLGLLCYGVWVVREHDNRAGTGAHVPGRWPAHSALVQATDRPTLIVLAHPPCTSTRTRFDELAEVLARSPKAPKTYVLFLRPSNVDARWEQTDLWRRASALPGVTVLRDDDG